MQDDQQRALMSIALLAAFADGSKADAEREEIKRIAQSLAGESGAQSLAGLYQDVLLGRIDAAAAAAVLQEPGQRQLAYELAVCVCDADGAQSAAERAFLAGLKRTLGLGAAETAEVEREADAIAAVDVTQPGPGPGAAGPAGTALATAPAPASATSTPAGTVAAATSKVPEAELDQSILNHAVLNGALELLPQSWASMAIIPLQMKLVYRIGQAHGYELDQGHIKEFVATAGVGLTSQYIEQIGRKLLGGLLGKVGGGLGRGLGSTATGMAFSFASTYALGHLAKRYYAGGRQMSTAMLRDTFQSLLEPAKQLQTQYLPQIQQKARSIDARQILAMVKGA